MTTSQAPVVCPEGTTHVWTPAVQRPRINHYIVRRAYYKLGDDDEWYSFNTFNRWVKTNNDEAWFEAETRLGYFVPIETFNSPGFVPVVEVV
jgi:hypothetical protein